MKITDDPAPEHILQHVLLIDLYCYTKNEEITGAKIGRVEGQGHSITKVVPIVDRHSFEVEMDSKDVFTITVDWKEQVKK